MKYAALALALAAVRGALAQNVSCTAIPSLLGNVNVLQTAQSHDDFPADGEPIGIGAATTAKGDSTTALQTVDSGLVVVMDECQSSYMNYTNGQVAPGIYRYYGRIRLVGTDANAPAQCLTVGDLDDGIVTFADCVDADDRSQTLQTWTTVENTTSMAPSPITFVGNVTYTVPKRAGYFSTYLSPDGNTSLVNQTYFDALNERTPYQMYIHGRVRAPGGGSS